MEKVVENKYIGILFSIFHCVILISHASSLQSAKERPQPNTRNIVELVPRLATCNLECTWWNKLRVTFEFVLVYFMGLCRARGYHGCCFQQLSAFISFISLHSLLSCLNESVFLYLVQKRQKWWLLLLRYLSFIPCKCNASEKKIQTHF